MFIANLQCKIVESADTTTAGTIPRSTYESILSGLYAAFPYPEFFRGLTFYVFITNDLAIPNNQRHPYHPLRTDFWDSQINFYSGTQQIIQSEGIGTRNYPNCFDKHGRNYSKTKNIGIALYTPDPASLGSYLNYIFARQFFAHVYDALELFKQTENPLDTSQYDFEIATTLDQALRESRIALSLCGRPNPLLSTATTTWNNTVNELYLYNKESGDLVEGRNDRQFSVSGAPVKPLAANVGTNINFANYFLNPANISTLNMLQRRRFVEDARYFLGGIDDRAVDGTNGRVDPTVRLNIGSLYGGPLSNTVLSLSINTNYYRRYYSMLLLIPALFKYLRGRVISSFNSIPSKFSYASSATSSTSNPTTIPPIGVTDYIGWYREDPSNYSKTASERRIYELVTLGLPQQDSNISRVNSSDFVLYRYQNEGGVKRWRPVTSFFGKNYAIDSSDVEIGDPF